jgi:dTDP-4-dehydrorhamnose 3,5-epimerase
MIIANAGLDGLYKVQLEPKADERGTFERVFCRATFLGAGLNIEWPQMNVSRTLRRGALRGLHFQAPPGEEIKLVTCLSGTVFDVVVDLRHASPTYGQWRSFDLSEQNATALYIPAGFAHGFQCVTEECRMLYLMSCEYDQSLARGLHWADPRLAIPWPRPVSCISPADSAWPALADLG